MKAAAAINEMIRLIGTLILIIFISFLIFNSVTSGDKARRAIEEASILHIIRSSVNSISTVEKGYIEKELRGTYDVVIKCGKFCRADVTIVSAAGSQNRESGKKEGKSEGSSVVLFRKVKPAELKAINSICISKDDEIEVSERCLNYPSG
jgi:hypothetical protein